MFDAVVLPSGVVLRSLREQDAAAMLDVHVRNREHLAPYEFPRPESFFTLDGQRDRMRSIVAEEQAGEVITRVMVRGAQVVGFSCLTRITPAPLCGADLGYWTDAAEQGRGLAGAAVAHLLAVAEARGLHRIEAATAPGNVPSQKVLVKNGFSHYGTAHGHLFLNGAWQDSHLYERVLNDVPPR
ncbi:ribosomal protein S5-alanine N-acetyltransferase [Actinoplanes sichuanensis]|uniref:GNAT family N-acetyltransferase n=1 Tax=Actinoplanes sichuanensis TaxID=512349 RepID=A0ABW4AU69_9ACTN|nr:GNAT family protein [Actinoplanes sichuanensis]BEL04713.1 ribosomal protein S5-alanine N-acetyltransferase [Actinoplanes sichuanensis]